MAGGLGEPVEPGAPSASVGGQPERAAAGRLSGPPRTYARRWYIVALFSALALFQNTVWNTFGPVAAAARAGFGWSNTVVSMLGDVGCLAFIVFIAPYCWLLDRRGVRPAVLVMAGATAVGTALRCVSSQRAAFTAAAFVCAALNGVAGIMAMAAPPHVSELWFPPEERTTATGLPNVLNQLGGSVAFVIGPQLVRQPAGGDAADAAAARTDIMTLMYVEAGVAGGLLLAALAHFPSRPPRPPSASAARPTGSFWAGLRRAARAPDLPWVVAVYSVSQGVQAAYFGVLDINVAPLGVTEDQAGWLGFWAGISCCVSALAVARLTDRFRGHMKATIVCLLAGGGLCFAWQLAVVAQWLPFSLPALYAATLLSISCTYSASPLLLEYAAELSYPVPTDVVGVVMTFCYNCVAVLYLLLFLIKPLSERTVWLNYILVVSCAVPAVMMLKTDEVYRRTDVDLAHRRASAVGRSEGCQGAAGAAKPADELASERKAGLGNPALEP